MKAEICLCVLDSSRMIAIMDSKLKITRVRFLYLLYSEVSNGLFLSSSGASPQIIIYDATKRLNSTGDAMLMK